MNDAPGTVVDRLHADASYLLAALDDAGELSLRAVADENLRKSLLMAAASYFENRMTKAVLVFVEEATNQNVLIVELVRKKAVSRQYHTWFEWRGNNANSFFGLFGDDFRDFMKRRVKDDRALDDSIRAFRRLGNERNRLVHEDYGTFALEKTSKEIYALYRRAMRFVEAVPAMLQEFDAGRRGSR